MPHDHDHHPPADLGPAGAGQVLPDGASMLRVASTDGINTLKAHMRRAISRPWDEMLCVEGPS
ncbi:hypothetical protein C5F48_06840 [Cereibacter changlensis JA139]|uniref:Uncharacterized protein n=1 Tax=Cereibacter changlensis JA139 TaxID=1188249 RepID=A0A2T4JXJ2_9RHOB|nr:hypothetical protein C5F48_06840 [Cereibacter changlensis JA139]